METSLTLTVPKFLFLPPKISVAQNLGGGGGGYSPSHRLPARTPMPRVVLWWSLRELRSSDWSLGVGSWKIASRLSLDSCYNCSDNVFPRLSLLDILSSIFSRFFITDPASHLAHCMLHRSTRRATRIQLSTLLKAVQAIGATEYKALNVTAVLVAKVECWSWSVEHTF